MSEQLTAGKGNPLGYEKISKLIRAYALPSVLSMVVNALYNIVDQIFIGRGVGYLGNGATNVILPFTILGIALGLLFGDGGAAYLSLQLGRGEKAQASKGVANAMVGQIVTGIALCVVLLVFLKPICILFGATENILPYALDYGWIIALGMPIVVFSSGMAGIIRADGSPKISMLGLMLGCIINIVLDAVFVLVLGWGVAGAAVATIIGQYVNGALFIWYQWHYKNVELHRDYFKVKFSVLEKVMGLGISSFITQIAVVVVIVVINRLLVYYGGLSKYGEDIPITALGVTMKINNILIGIFTGIATGCQPIIGFNYGAGKTDRSKQTLFQAVIIASICAAVATACFQLFPMPIVSIFGSESELYNEFAVKCLRIFLMLCIFDGFNNVAAVFFQAIGKPGRAAVSTLLRQTIFLIPPACIFGAIWGVEGILYAGPFAAAASALMIFFIICPQVKKL